MAPDGRNIQTMKRYIFFLLLSCMVHAAIAQEAVLLDLKTYGGNGSDGVGKHVLRTDDGGFLLSFGTQSTLGSGSIATLCTGGGARSVYLKYNASASSLLWSKCSAVGGGAYMFPRSDGSFYFGQQLSIPGGSTVRVRSEDADENLLWSRQYGSGASPFLRGMIACEDGGYIIVCEVFYTDTDVVSHYGSWSNADIWAMKVDADGYKVWSKVIGGTGDEIVFSISSAPGDGCYILGTTQSNDYDCTGNHGGIDAYVVHLDKDGNILWHRDLGGSELDGGLFGMVVLNEGGGPLIAAVTESSDGGVHHHIGGQDYWVINMDSDGNIIWENCYGSTTFEYPEAICRATDGSVWVIGTSFGSGGQINAHYGRSDSWVAHADANGNFINGKVLGGTGGDRGTMIYALEGGSVLAGGGLSSG